MRKKCSLFLTVTGAVLILSALLLFLFNYRENLHAGRESEKMMMAVELAIAQKTASSDASDATSADDTRGAPLSNEVPVSELDGCGYLGFIEIPRLDLKLPVMSEWDYERLKSAPCRQFGSSRTDDLVIAAHNFACHFGHIGKLKAGDAVFFTDMDGVFNSYTVSKTETVSPKEQDHVRLSGYALVLYTCTADGSARCAVFCRRE